MTEDEEKKLHAEMMDALAEFQREGKMSERRPDQVEICCLILALAFIAILTIFGAPAWVAPFTLLPNLGKSGASAFLDLFRKD
jgi:hypothetical protein